MAEKEERETNRRDYSGPHHARDFELQIRAKNSEQKQQRRKRGDPKGNLLEASRGKRDDICCEPGFLCQIGNRIGDTVCE